MPQPGHNDKRISVLDVCYYLDAQRQNGIDRGSAAMRSGAVLALRTKLLALPEREFDFAVRALNQMVEAKEPRSKAEAAERKEAAQELFRQSRQGDLITNKISPV